MLQSCEEHWSISTNAILHLMQTQPMTTDLGTTELGTQNKKPMIEFVYMLNSQLMRSFIFV